MANGSANFSVVKIGAWAGAIAAVGAIVKWVVMPPLTIAVAEAVAGDIKDELKQEIGQEVEASVARRVAPLSAGFKVMLQQNVNNLEREISRLEFQRTNNQNWTSELNEELSDKRLELRAHQAALEAIAQAEAND